MVIERGRSGSTRTRVSPSGADPAAGAEAVMLGCTCMSPMAAKVASAVRVPVINPFAEAAMSAARLAAGQTRAEPAIRTERAAVVARMVDAVAGEADEACPVCVAEDFAG